MNKKLLMNLNKSIVDNNVIVNENNDKTIIGNEYEDKLIVITQTVNNSSEWQFEDGEDIINVNIKDEEFLKKYSLQEIPILPRAVFKVIRRVDKINKNNKIKKIHYIIKVINYDEKEINLFI